MESKKKVLSEEMNLHLETLQTMIIHPEVKSSLRCLGALAVFEIVYVLLNFLVVDEEVMKGRKFTCSFFILCGSLTSLAFGHPPLEKDYSTGREIHPPVLPVTVNFSFLPEPTASSPPDLSQMKSIKLDRNMMSTVKIGNHHLEVLFDSGTTKSAMNLKTAVELGLSKYFLGPRPHTVHYVDHSRHTRAWFLPKERVEMYNGRAIMVDFTVVEEFDEPPVIGASIFDEYQCVQAYSCQSHETTLYFGRRRREVQTPEGYPEYTMHSVLETNSARQFVNVLLDTGCFGGVLMDTRVQAIIKPQDTYSSEQQLCLQVSGQLTDTGSAPAHKTSVQVMPLVLDDVVLGNDFFRRHNCILDFGERQAYLDPGNGSYYRTQMVYGRKQKRRLTCLEQPALNKNVLEDEVAAY